MSKLTDLIEPSNTWEIIDSSKLATYMDCPRQYFYHYVLGWQKQAVNNHLVFGTAWHAAVEYLLNEGYSSKALDGAKYTFLHYYREELPEDTDHMFPPKSPADAIEALDLYAKKFSTDRAQYTVNHTEIAGVVLINVDSPMYFKMDAILQNNYTGKHSVMDHKTSQRRPSNWSSIWQLKTQLLLYLHSLYCLYGGEEVQGARVRGSFFYKSKPSEFDEAVIEKTPTQMQAWINGTNHWYNMLKHDMEELEQDSTSQDVMNSFPQYPNACDKYFGCPYMDFCNAWPNPLARCEEPPLGFEIRYWNPLEIPTIRETMDLTTNERNQVPNVQTTDTETRQEV